MTGFTLDASRFAKAGSACGPVHPEPPTMTPNPIDSVLATVNWQHIDDQADEPDELHATHHGVLEIAGACLRCYRLSNGQAVIHKDDLEAFLFASVERGEA